MRFFKALPCLSLFTFFFTQHAAAEYTAVATAYGYQGTTSVTISSAKLEVIFTQSAPGATTNIQVMATGVPVGTYGFHIHTYGDMESPLAANGSSVYPIKTASPVPYVGGHFNPFDAPHGCYPNPVRHVGDVGNLTITDASITTTHTLTSDLIELSNTFNSTIIGRAIIMHSKPDICVQPTGDAGTPIMQGVVGLKAVTNQQASGLPQPHLKATFQARNPQTNAYMIIGAIDCHNATEVGYRCGRNFKNVIGATAMRLWFFTGAGEDFASSVDPSVPGINGTVNSDNINFDFQLTSNYTSQSLLGNSMGLQITGGIFDNQIIRATIGINSDQTTTPLSTTVFTESPMPPGPSGSGRGTGPQSQKSSANGYSVVGAIAVMTMSAFAL